MHAPLQWLPGLILLLATAAAAQAVEKNGYQYDVQKTVIERGDNRVYYTTQLDRLTGLKVSLKNITFKEMPAGEIAWEILNRKYNSTTLELTSGTEKLPAIKSGQKLDLTIGQANVRGYIYGARRYVDELEWQLTVTREGKEELRINSTKNFDQLAKRAVRVDIPGSEPPKP
jgi:hypothetical protein